MPEQRITEAVYDLRSSEPTGRRWEVTLLREGKSLNAGVRNRKVHRYYSGDLIRNSARLFEGAWACADHPTPQEMRERPGGSVSNRIGFFDQVRAVRENGAWALKARFNVINETWRQTLLNAARLGRPDFAGFSINAIATGFRERKLGGRELVEEVSGISAVSSVDLVTTPAAGGSLDRVLESVSTPGGATMPDTIDTEQLARRVAEEAASAAERRFANLLAEALDEVEEEDTVPTHLTEATGLNEGLARITEQQQVLQRQLYHERGRRAIQEAVSSAGLPPVGQDRVWQQAHRLLESGTLNSEVLGSMIQEERDYLARIAQANPIGTPGFQVLQEGSISGIDDYPKRLLGMIMGESIDGTRPFASIKEAYHSWPGHSGQSVFDTSPYQILGSMNVGYDSEINNTVVTEGYTTASWGEVFADVMYQALARRLKDLPYNDWRKLTSEIESIDDFRDRRWIRIGYVGNIPTVSEGQPYPYIDPVLDEEATLSISKYGSLQTVTIEAIAQDKLNLLRGIPKRLAYAWSRTLFELIMDAATIGNPTCTYDSTALYHANHSNTNTLALTVPGLNSTQVAMRKMKPYDAPTTEYMGARNKVKYLIVPPDLEARAETVVDPSEGYQGRTTNVGDSQSAALLQQLDADTSIDPWMFRKSGIEVLVYDKAADTSTTTWYAAADPKLVDMLAVGFWKGRETPELFVQNDDNRAGAAFTADVITYKIRAWAGVTVLDHRGLYRNVPS